MRPAPTRDRWWAFLASLCLPGVGQAWAGRLSALGWFALLPAVFFLSIGPEGTGTRLEIRVRGRWTARFVPRWIIRAWLRSVATEHGRLIRSALATA